MTHEYLIFAKVSSSFSFSLLNSPLLTIFQILKEIINFNKIKIPLQDAGIQYLSIFTNFCSSMYDISWITASNFYQLLYLVVRVLSSNQKVLGSNLKNEIFCKKLVAKLQALTLIYGFCLLSCCHSILSRLILLLVQC